MDNSNASGFSSDKRKCFVVGFCENSQMIEVFIFSMRHMYLCRLILYLVGEVKLFVRDMYVRRCSCRILYQQYYS